MRSPFGGFVCTLLIFVPLVAVPCLAVFGIPRTAQSSSASPAEDLKFAADRDVQISDPIANNQASTNPTASDQQGHDPFSEFTRSPDDADAPRASTKQVGQLSNQSRSAQAEGGPVDEGNGIPEKSLVALGSTNRRPKADDVVAERAAEDSSVDMTSERTRSKGNMTTTGQRESSDEAPIPVGRTLRRPEKLNWRSAVARLNALGIHDYELQPGEREGDFHFSCRLVSRVNPRVMMRFRAEAPDPLEAVGNVLRQVDDWKRQNSARASTWFGRPSQSMLTARGASDDGASAADTSGR